MSDVWEVMVGAFDTLIFTSESDAMMAAGVLARAVSPQPTAKPGSRARAVLVPVEVRVRRCSLALPTKGRSKRLAAKEQKVIGNR